MKRLAAIIVLGLVAQAFAGIASALPVDAASTGGGRGCIDQACTVQTLTWGSSTGGGTGWLDIVDGELSFSITLSSTTFVPVSGGSDNGVTALVFSNTTYTGSATVASLGGGYYGIVAGTASIDGTQTPSGAGVAGSFTVASAQLSGMCQAVGTGINCGIVFGPAGDFSFDVNGETRYFTHTVNVTAIPEPQAAILYGIGLLVAGAAGRSRRSRTRDR